MWPVTRLLTLLRRYYGQLDLDALLDAAYSGRARRYGVCTSVW
jgi:hypothetical protein